MNAPPSHYLSPDHASVPKIEAILSGGNGRSFGAPGATATGALPMVRIAASITRAAHHTTGVPARDLPIRLEDVLA